jgi:hypothetical protein
MYLYRAVDSTGQTLDFLLNETRSTYQSSFRKVTVRSNVNAPRVINVDKNPTYIGAVRDLKQEMLLPGTCTRRPSQYVDEQHGGTRSSVLEMQDQARIGFRIIPDCLAHDSGLRDDTHDMERTHLRHRERRHHGTESVRLGAVWPNGIDRGHPFSTTLPALYSLRFFVTQTADESGTSSQHDLSPTVFATESGSRLGS